MEKIGFLSNIRLLCVVLNTYFGSIPVAISPAKVAICSIVVEAMLLILILILLF